MPPRKHTHADVEDVRCPVDIFGLVMSVRRGLCVWGGGCFRACDSLALFLPYSFPLKKGFSIQSPFINVIEQAFVATVYAFGCIHIHVCNYIRVYSFSQKRLFSLVNGSLEKGLQCVCVQVGCEMDEICMSVLWLLAESKWVHVPNYMKIHVEHRVQWESVCLLPDFFSLFLSQFSVSGHQTNFSIDNLGR